MKCEILLIFATQRIPSGAFASGTRHGYQVQRVDGQYRPRTPSAWGLAWLGFGYTRVGLGVAVAQFSRRGCRTRLARSAPPVCTTVVWSNRRSDRGWTLRCECGLGLALCLLRILLLRLRLSPNHGVMSERMGLVYPVIPPKFSPFPSAWPMQGKGPPRVEPQILSCRSSTLDR